MKKNALLVASVAGLIFLSSAATFASTNGTLEEGRRHTTMSTNKYGSGKALGLRMGSGAKLHDKEGRGEGKGMGMGGMFGLKDDTEHQALMDTMRTAIEANNYSAYSTAYDNAKMTTTQFAEAVKMHTSRTAMDTALTNKNYSAFLTAIKGTPMEGQVTQAQFTEMATRHANMLARSSK